MLRCPQPIKHEIARRVEQSRAAVRAGDDPAAWHRLEEAHILSQPWPTPHVGVHRRMLGLALRRGPRREIPGQVFRILVAGPGSAAGRYPVGNTGRADVSAFAPMPMPDDLRALLDAHL